MTVSKRETVLDLRFILRMRMRYVMAEQPLQGVTVDAASVEAFMDGIFGQAKRKNQAAKRGFEKAVTAGLIYAAYKHVKGKRAPR
jgi:hypothetical protein